MIIAVIGLGQMGATYVKYATNYSQKVVCYDISFEQIKSLSKRIELNLNPFDTTVESPWQPNNLVLVTNLEDLWNYNPDLVIVTTHKDSHAYYSCLAMSKGCHVLTEKPLCMTLKEAEEIYQSSKENKKYLYVGFSLHATPPFIELKNILHRENLCNLKKYRVYRIGEVPEDYMDSVSARFDLLSHDTDLCLQLFNFPTYTTVKEPSWRECDKYWYYDGFKIEMIGRMPVKHPKGFEYGFNLTYKNGDEIEYSSTNQQEILLKKNGCITKKTLAPISQCETILKQAIKSIKNDGYGDYLEHCLSIKQGVMCMRMLVNDLIPEPHD